MSNIEEQMAKWGEQFRFPRPQSFAEDAEAVRENLRVTEETTALEGEQFSQPATTRVRYRAGCECNVSTLGTTYEVTVDGPDYPGIVDVEMTETGATCWDVVYEGGPNDFMISAVINFVGYWQLSVDGPGDEIVLIKIPTGGCDISSPKGAYEGSDHTATVGLIE